MFSFPLDTWVWGELKEEISTHISMWVIAVKWEFENVMWLFSGLLVIRSVNGRDHEVIGHLFGSRNFPDTEWNLYPDTPCSQLILEQSDLCWNWSDFDPICRIFFNTCHIRKTPSLIPVGSCKTDKAVSHCMLVLPKFVSMWSQNRGHSLSCSRPCFDDTARQGSAGSLSEVLFMGSLILNGKSKWR